MPGSTPYSAQILSTLSPCNLLAVATKPLSFLEPTSKELAKAVQGKTKQEKAFIIGQEIAKRANEKGISNVVFDRAGYVYTGNKKEK